MIETVWIYLPLDLSIHIVSTTSPVNFLDAHVRSVSHMSLVSFGHSLDLFVSTHTGASFIHSVATVMDGHVSPVKIIQHNSIFFIFRSFSYFTDYLIGKVGSIALPSFL